MNVRVRLFSTFREYGPKGDDPVVLDLPDGVTVLHVLEAMGIPTKAQKVVLVNGRHAQEDSLVSEGDLVTLFPPVEGG